MCVFSFDWLRSVLRCEVSVFLKVYVPTVGPKQALRYISKQKKILVKYEEACWGNSDWTKTLYLIQQ